MLPTKVQYKGKRFTLIGDVTTAFQDSPQFFLSAGLNQTDPEAIRINAELPALDLDMGDLPEGKTPPKILLMKNARIASGADETVFTNALIVPAGAAIEFVFGCRSTVGFGFALRPTGQSATLDGHTDIVSRLYGVSSPLEDGYRYEVIRRFQDASADLLVINPAGAYNSGVVRSEDRAGRWIVQADTWELKRYIDPITSMVYSASQLPKSQAAQAPRHTRSASSISSIEPGLSMMAAGSLFDGVSPGVLVGGGRKSEQAFNPIRVIEEGAAIGALTLTLFIV